MPRKKLTYNPAKNGKHLTEWMWIMAMSANEVADLVGVSASSIHKLRRGFVAPSLEVAICLHTLSNGYVNLWHWMDLKYRVDLNNRLKKLKPLHEEAKRSKRKRLNLHRPRSLSNRTEDIIAK
jgi:plasmid maintenance system antidote protein VapI